LESQFSHGFSASIDSDTGIKEKLQIALPVLFWIVILSPVPIAIKLISVSLILLVCDIEFTYIIALLAGFFKLWGNAAILYEVVDLTLLAVAIGYVRTILQLLTSSPPRVDRLTVRFLLYLFVVEGIMLATLLWTIAPSNGLDKVCRYFIITNSLILLPLLHSSSRRSFSERAIAYLLVHAAAFSLVAVLMKASEVANADYIGLGRLSGMGLLISLFFFVLAEKHRGKKPGRRVLGILLMLVTGGALLYSGARGPTLGLVITLLAIGVLTLRFPARFSRYSAVLGLFVAVLGILMALKLLPATAYYRFIEVILEGRNVMGGRLPLFAEAARMFQEAPIWGKGIGSFAVFIGVVNATNAYPHNIVLEIASELGLIGIVASVALFHTVYLKAKFFVRNSLRSRWHAYGIMGLLLFSAINSLVSGDLNSNKYLWFSIGILLACRIPVQADLTSRGQSA